MRKFQDELGLHLPPPGDLRRCLFMMSNSPKRDAFQQYLETVIEQDFKISQLSIWDYFRLVGAGEDFKKYLENIAAPFSPKGERIQDRGLTTDWIDFTLPLTSSIK